MSKFLRKINDLTRADVLAIIDSAFAFKQGRRAGQPLTGKVIAMIFEKPSLRTKVAFEVAAATLGATPVFLTSSQILASGSNQSGRESVPDIARNLERYADLILARVYSHSVVEEIAASIEKPVLNGLCDRHHPTQALADLMAIRWHKGNFVGLKAAFIGDGNNVATSFAQICAMVGINVVHSGPEGYDIPSEEFALAQELGRSSGAEVSLCRDPLVAVSGADIVYTDTFVSMGQEQEGEKRFSAFAAYQVNRELMAAANPKAIFMHCLPAHREEEVSNEVFDSEASIVFDQAECRMHIAKSLYCYYLEPKA